MKFEKKLIILSGGGGAKGTLNLERNAYGTFATLNVYNVPDLYAGEYALGVKNASGAFVRKIGSPGRILSRFKIDDIDISAVHCVVFDSNTDTPVMYGTNDVKKLWGGNLMDGLRSAKVERKKDITPQALEKALPSYSERPREIADYFLDIAPSDETAYADDRVAEVNYYPGDMRITVAYSDRPADAVIDENPVDEHLRRTERPESSDKAMPWQYAKSYINRYKNELALKEAAERAAAENEKAAPAPQAAEQAFASGQDAEPPQADERIFARTETAGQISVSEQDAVSDYAEFVADGETEFETPATDINGAGEQAAIRPETAAPEQTAANRDGGFSDSRPPRADIDETGEQAVIRPETAAPEQAAANRDGGFSDSRPPRADINGASEQAAIRPESTAPEQAALNRDGGFSDSR
ncbi:MAG: hypothetical protein LBP26_02845, partial [Clostridiales bacterium]|nr:hypothetical protein [Clostridiales bacterium]